MAELFKSKKELLLYSQIYKYMIPISFKTGLVEVCLADGANREDHKVIGKKLREWTGNKWTVSLSSNIQKTDTNITLAQRDDNIKKERLANAVTHPILEQVLENFPGAKITKLSDI